MEVEKTGRTVEAAVEEALNALGIPSDEAVITVLEEPRSGLLGIGGRPARVHVRVRTEQDDAQPAPAEKAEKMTEKAEKMTEKAEKMTEKAADKAAEKAAPQKAEKAAEKVAENADEQPAQTAKPRRPRRGRDAGAPDEPTLQEMAASAQAFLQQVTTAMGLSVTFSCTFQEDGLTLTAEGDQADQLIGHRGETLDALQYITAQVIGCGAGLRLRLDAQGYRARREQALLRLADEAARQVVRSRKRVVMEAMPAAERRIIHTALSDHFQVVTTSEGEEPRRRVVVMLRSEAERQEDR